MKQIALAALAFLGVLVLAAGWVVRKNRTR
jgi:hypothetical protein